MAVALKTLAPHVRVIGVEAETLPAATRSREAGRLVTIPPGVDLARYRPGDRAAARRTLGVAPDAVVLCAFGAAALAIMMWQKQRPSVAAGFALLGAAFVLKLYQ